MQENYQQQSNGKNKNKINNLLAWQPNATNNNLPKHLLNIKY